MISKFIKNHQDVHDKFVRQAYGILAGVLGIICNLLLFILKLTIGLYINSIAVISDAFNNLTDLGSSLIAIIGAKLSNSPADIEHPYGHGRLEYISSLVVSFVILSVGLQLLLSSFRKILRPEEVLLSPLSIFMLMLAVVVKLWMYLYNKFISKTINSRINKAIAFDSLSDAIATSAVIVTTIVGVYVDFPLDGIIGVVISILILYTGFSIAKDTVNLLLGSSPDAELVNTVNLMVKQGRYIIGTHDLKMHDYGPGRVIASIHAEVPDNLSFVEIHGVIDELEEKISEELGINIVIHLDPICTDKEKNTRITTHVITIIKQINEDLTIQNVRITDGANRVSVIFDLLVPPSILQSQYEEIRKLIIEQMKEDDGKFNVIISSVITLQEFHLS